MKTAKALGDIARAQGMTQVGPGLKLNANLRREAEVT